jgi:hypothetical protein
MRYLKLFESFRQPKQITIEDVRKKLSTHGVEKFSEFEKDFFMEVLKDIENKRIIDDWIFKPTEMWISILSLNSDRPEEITIEKLGDNWYIITQILSLYDEDDLPEDPQYKYYEVDEWEEVLGFLTRNTLLELPTS